MLREMNIGISQPFIDECCVKETKENRYKRNEKEDIKLAIEHLYEFKKKLEELHPKATDVIEKLLQNQHHNRY
jgi:hypothetical protein